MARPYRIVVGFDGSESAGRALDRAAGLVGYGSRVRVVFVAAGPAGLGASGSVLTQARERFRLLGVVAETTAREGSPVDELIAAVAEADADLLVVGAGTPASELAGLGSVSKTLVERAPCDVLVAK